MSSGPNHDRVEEFLTLLSGCERRLYGYILSLVQHFHDADDIAQETRKRLWEQFDSFQPGTNFEAWARTIARYQVLTHHEQRSRTRLTFQPELMEQLSEEFEAATEHSQARQGALLDCLQSVEGSVRSLLQLVYAQGLSIKDAAQRLKRPIDGTYKALWRARQALQLCIEKKLRQEES